MTEAEREHQTDLGRTLQLWTILLGIPVWAFLWFWPMVGADFRSYAGIDYVLHSNDAVAQFFFSGLFVGSVVLLFVSLQFRR